MHWGLGLGLSFTPLGLSCRITSTSLAPSHLANVIACDYVNAYLKVQLDGRAEPTNALRLVVVMDPNCAAGALPLDAAPNSD